MRLQLVHNPDAGKRRWLRSSPPRGSLHRIDSSVASCLLEQSCGRKQAGPQVSRTPTPRTWDGTGSAVAQVDPCCPAVVAGLVALLRPAVGAELADPQRLAEEAGKLDSQHSEEEAELAGSAMAVENWTRLTPWCPLEWVSC
jgi:hypothetical protein